MNLKVHVSFEKLNTLDSIEEGLYKATQSFLFKGVLNSMYLSEVTEELSKSAAYMIIREDTILLHARPSSHVKEPFVAYLYTEKPVLYHQKNLKHFFVFGAKDNQAHLNLLSSLVRYISKSDTYDKESLYRHFNPEEDSA